MRVAVIALGKIGLPLAVQIAGKGFEVRGVDISSRVVDLVNSGTPPFPGEADLDWKLAEVVEAGTLKATTETAAAVAQSDVVVVVVPLMTDDSGIPDFGAMDAATRSLAEGLQPGTLISYETTLPVGTTRNRFAPMIAEATGLEPSSDFYLVHSPERVYSGRVFADLRKYPKLVGGIDPESASRGVEFYEKILDFDERPELPRGNGVWALSSAEAAEMAKLAETTYRDVNIALANEFAAFAEGAGIRADEVIEAANSQPYSHIHRPGVAVGGHCIPIYPRFYLSSHPGAELVETARRVNQSVPVRAVEWVADALDGLLNKRVLILGAAYRGGVKESAYSGVFDLARAIKAGGGEALVSDPMYNDDELTTLGLQPWDGRGVDAIIIQADHGEYRALGPDEFPGVSVIYDGRGIIDADRWTDAGVTTRVIGQGKTAF